MVEIRPFRGVRYNPEKVNDLSLLAVPPYDVILPPPLRKYRARHSKNFIYLTLGKQGVEKNRKKGNYGKAAKLLQEWFKEGTLLQDSAQCFYIYEERFKLNGEKYSRTGLIGLLGLGGKDGNVLEHEKTMDKPFEDRMLLLEATKADLEPIFMLFEDGGEVQEVLEKVKSGKPVAELVDDDNVEQKLWLLQDPMEQAKIAVFFKGKDLIIADGHHRHKTALAFMEKHKGKAAKYKMVYLLGLNDRGLKILSTHRALLKVESKKDFLEKLGGFFYALPVSRGEMFYLMNEECNHCFGLLFENRYYLLRERRKGSINEELDRKEVPEILQELPTTVLHSIVFEECLKPKPENIIFEKSARKLVKGIEAGRLEAAFFLKPTSLEQFEAVARKGQLMPPKSTYFYPKPLSGLVFYKL